MQTEFSHKNLNAINGKKEENLCAGMFYDVREELN